MSTIPHDLLRMNLIFRMLELLFLSYLKLGNSTQPVKMLAQKQQSTDNVAVQRLYHRKHCFSRAYFLMDKNVSHFHLGK